MLTLRAKPQTHIRLVSLQTCSLSETVVNIYPPGTVTAVLQVLSVLMADISLSQKYRLPVTITPATEPAAQRQAPQQGTGASLLLLKSDWARSFSELASTT